ncbi:MAG: radical SAM protein [Candidatus Bathyarchaeia archaeon]
MLDSPPPAFVKVSIGSAITLGLAKGRLDAKPTTIYLLTHYQGKCIGNCAFCSQARESLSKADLLSRVIWPTFETREVINSIRNIENKEIRRVCIQTINYPNVYNDLLALCKSIMSCTGLPISVSCKPLRKKQIEQLHALGVDRIGIPIDAASKSIFDKVKGRAVGGPYRWTETMHALRNAVSIFGKYHVTTHLIVGMGERDDELLETIQKMVDMGVHPSLFAFTPILGSKYENLPQPSIERYRRIQMAQYLIAHKIADVKAMEFDSSGNLVSFGIRDDLVLEVAQTGLPFMTSGCPGCNRPFYNERPGGKIYNYPSKPNPADIENIVNNLFIGIKDG